jgi:hypothetical protein
VITGGVPIGQRLPLLARPPRPSVAILIEHEQRLVAQLRELRTPSRPASHSAVVEDRTDDVDFLAVVHLVPERLQHLAQRRAFDVPPVHEPRDVLQADVAGQQLLVIEHAHAAVPIDLVTVESEMHFLDAIPLGRGTERGFGREHRH